MAKVVENWVKFQKETFDKPEVRKIAKLLGTHEVHAAAYCLSFWCYVDSHMRDGFVAFTDRDDIDGFAHCPGFADALEAVGWARFEDGGVYIPNPDTHLTGGAKGRAEATARQHNHRASKALGESDEPKSAASRQPVTSSRDTPSQKSVTREEKRREDPPPPTPPSPRSPSALKAQQAAEEAEAVKSLGPEWGKSLSAVQRAGPKAAAGAVLAASRLGYEPAQVETIAAVFVRHRKLFASSGALVDRLTTVGPEVPTNLGWIVDIPAEPAKARGPTLDELANAYAAELKARGIVGEERIRLMDEWHEKHGAVPSG